MEAKDIKEYIYKNNKVEYILEKLGMHSIKWHNGDEYITCGMPDGDNPSSTTIYNDSFLGVIAYTRDIKDAYGISDIISLVTFVKQCFFTESISWLCDLCGLDYYGEAPIIDKSINFKDILNTLINSRKNNIDEQLKPISEDVLQSYLNWNNTEFIKDNVSCETQTEFRFRFRCFFTQSYYTNKR